MTMIDAVERPDTTEAEVILGVDTHLDFHVAVVVDHLGRRLVHDQATFCGTVRCSSCGQSNTPQTLSASSYAPRSPSASTTLRLA